MTDLSQFKGPDPKPDYSLGGTGKKKPNRKAASPKRKAEIRAKKATVCRVCPNPDGFAIHAHHVVREGSPWFGQWTENNIVGLCVACHKGVHDGDDRVKKILRARLTDSEVEYADGKAYPGYVDETYAELRPLGVNPGTLDVKPPPYPQFCRHPDQCAGLSACPRDMSCID